jgi:hypothetical protein
MIAEITNRSNEVAYPPEAYREIHGLGLVILHGQTGAIWAVRERTNKPATGRKRGELSIPLETRKVGETPMNNLLGAMAEAFDDVDSNGNDISGKLHASLYHVRGNSFHTGFTADILGNRILCDYAILVYDGEQISVQPYNSLEVGEAGWVNINSFLGDGVRPLARQVITQAMESDFLALNLIEYRDFSEKRLHVLPKDFSIRSMYRNREKLRDMG